MDGQSIPGSTAEREKFFKSLSVFVDHGDGEQEIRPVKVVKLSENSWGVSFTVDRFSNFAILSVDGWKDAEIYDFDSYLTGYPDGTFKPNKTVTRAEFIALMNRVTGRTHNLNNIELSLFKDVARNHWAYQDVEKAARYYRYIIMKNGETIILLD